MPAKFYRIYFNRKREWPQIWSIDEGDQASEINVAMFILCGVAAESRNLGSEAALKTTDHDLHPFAWLELRGFMQVAGGIAHFYPENL